MELFKGSSDTIYSISETKPTEIIKYVSSNKTDTKQNADSIKSATDSTSINGKNYFSDSIIFDSTSTATIVNTDDIVVMKDELLAVKIIEVANPNSEIKNTKDSLLQKESGVRDDSKKLLGSYSVEFWQSPINYKGYKLINNKIVLFGIAKEETPQVFKLDDVIYLKLKQVVYRLDKTNNFKQFEIVKDQNLLAKIK